MSNTYQEVERQVDAFLDARKRRPKLVKVVDELDSLISRGRDHLHSWSVIRTAFRSDDRELIALAGWFFVTSAVAHLQAAALYAAKLTEDHKDSVNIHYLVRLVEAHPRPREQKPAVKLSVAEWRKRLAALEVDTSEIKKQRDQYLAHVDRSRFNSGIEGCAVEAERLERIFEGIEEILDKIGTQVRGHQQEAPDEVAFDDFLGPKGLNDLLYFARIAVRDREVPDPSAHSKRVRDLERSLREVERDLGESK